MSFNLPDLTNPEVIKRVNDSLRKKLTDLGDKGIETVGIDDKGNIVKSTDKVVDDDEQTRR